jgi:PAS domain S-box-containing protein
MSVIIVNDDATQLAVLSELVKKQGLEAHGFSSAESALRAMDPKRPPKLVVSDLYMPGIDGWRFCRLLRSPEFPAYNAVPILVVSATFAGDDAARIAADTGADAFLPSPVDGERFAGAVRNLLAGEAVVHRPRVLIVEDSRSLAETLKTAFENRGYRADLALEGREGIAAFAGKTFDAAAIDYHLPDGPGDSLLRGFRARNPDCVCVMMTSDPRPGLALEWMKSGAAAYARKPFAPEYLVELCDRARRERSLLRVEELLERRTRQLRSNEALGKTVLDALHEAIHIVGPDLRVLMANRRFREWFEELGLSADVLGRPLREIAPFLPEEVFAQYRRVFENGEPLFTEAENEVAGKRFFTETRKLPIPGPNGGPAVLTVISDVSRRREAEARLRRNNEEQALLLDAIPTQVWYLTDVETYGRVNRAHAEFLGRSKADMENKNWWIFSRGRGRSLQGRQPPSVRDPATGLHRGMDRNPRSRTTTAPDRQDAELRRKRSGSIRRLRRHRRHRTGSMRDPNPEGKGTPGTGRRSDPRRHLGVVDSHRRSPLFRTLGRNIRLYPGGTRADEHRDLAGILPPRRSPEIRGTAPGAFFRGTGILRMHLPGAPQKRRMGLGPGSREGGGAGRNRGAAAHDRHPYRHHPFQGNGTGAATVRTAALSDGKGGKPGAHGRGHRPSLQQYPFRRPGKPGNGHGRGSAVRTQGPMRSGPMRLARAISKTP